MPIDMYACQRKGGEDRIIIRPPPTQLVLCQMVRIPSKPLSLMVNFNDSVVALWQQIPNGRDVGLYVIKDSEFDHKITEHHKKDHLFYNLI